VPVRFHPWQLAVALICLCLALVALARWRATRVYPARELVRVLPADGATLIYLDAALLRDTGYLDALLSGSRANQEAEYLEFVEQTGFDYRADLDTVAAAFSPSASYFALRGRFQWKQLTTYAATAGGTCRYAICTMPGSTPERNISFYPLKPDVLALAVSPDPRAVTLISASQPVPVRELPSEPVWISTPTSVLRRPGALPFSLEAMLAPLVDADHLVLAAGPLGDHAQLRLQAFCRSPQSALSVEQQLAAAIQVLKASGQDTAKDPSGLAALLAGGSLEHKDHLVTGTWPVQRSFLETIFAR